MQALKVGLIINPYAGVGGPLAYKGSDNIPLATKVDLAHARAEERAQQTLLLLTSLKDRIEFFTVQGAMGSSTLDALSLSYTNVFKPEYPCSSADTLRAVNAFIAANVDIVVFVGGDGTARDVHSALGQTLPALGIPAGVKMHSGVFAINPQAAAQVLTLLIEGHVVAIAEAEVRDLDEEALRAGRVKTRYYGELKVPFDPRFVQQMKCAGPDNEELTQEDIAAEFIENADPKITYIFGPGSTTTAIVRALGFEKTLLGFDAIRDGELVAQDLDANAIDDLMQKFAVKAVITATPSQGILLGRGNQQLTPKVLRKLTKDGLVVVATSQKLNALEGRPLFIDTGDVALDDELSGFIEVISGYQIRSLYRVSAQV